MLFDVVQEVRALVEAGVSERPSQVEGVDGLKPDLKALTEEVNEYFNKHLLHTPKSAKDSVVTGHVNTLKEWTWKATATVIYDSFVDEFTDECLFDKLKGKPNIAVVGFTTDGDVFGAFYSRAVRTQLIGFTDFNDPDMFIFSFESHGRCMTPQKFVPKERLKKNAHVCFWNNNSCGFVELGVFGQCGFTLGNEKSRSCCIHLSRGFEGLEETTLTGQNSDYLQGPYHHCTRLVAVQLG